MNGVGIGGGLYLALIVLCIVIALLWILLPFAVFGLKDLVREVLKEQRRTNTLLEAAEKRSNGSMSSVAPASAPGSYLEKLYASDQRK